MANRTTIQFEYNGTAYTLGYTIASLKRLEKSGFSFGNLEDHLLTAQEDLFCAAFDAFHKNVPRNERMAIYKEFANSEGGEEGETANTLSDILFRMVNEVIEEMSPKGNVKWKTVRG